MEKKENTKIPCFIQSSLVKAEHTFSGFMSRTPRIWNREEKQWPSLLTYIHQRTLMILLVKQVPFILHEKKRLRFLGLCVPFAVKAGKIVPIFITCACSVMCILNTKTVFLSSPHALVPMSQKFCTLLLSQSQQPIPKILVMSPWLYWEHSLGPEATTVGQDW